MKKIICVTILPIISVISLIFIKYYEKVLYYRPFSSVLDATYRYVAVPAFYYSIAAFITMLIINFSKLTISENLRKGLKYFSGFALIVYVIFAFLNKPFIVFGSFYSFIFIILGCLLALTVKRKV